MGSDCRGTKNSHCDGIGSPVTARLVLPYSTHPVFWPPSRQRVRVRAKFALGQDGIGKGAGRASGGG